MRESTTFLVLSLELHWVGDWVGSKVRIGVMGESIKTSLPLKVELKKRPEYGNGHAHICPLLGLSCRPFSWLMCHKFLHLVRGNIHTNLASVFCRDSGSVVVHKSLNKSMSSFEFMAYFMQIRTLSSSKARVWNEGRFGILSQEDWIMNLKCLLPGLLSIVLVVNVRTFTSQGLEYVVPLKMIVLHHLCTFSPQPILLVFHVDSEKAWPNNGTMSCEVRWLASSFTYYRSFCLDCRAWKLNLLVPLNLYRILLQSQDVWICENNKKRNGKWNKGSLAGLWHHITHSS